MSRESSLNSSMPWIKLWTDFNDDPKIAKCSEGAQLLFIKLLAIAGKCDAEGYLVNGEAPLTLWDIAWQLHMDQDRAGELVDELIGRELLEDDEGYLLIPNFSKRQGRSQMQKREKWVERKQRSRAKNEPIVTGDIDDVTGDNTVCHTYVTLPEGEGEGEKRREEGEVEAERAGDCIPENPKQAMAHPDIRIFREATDRIPGIGQYRTVIQTVQLLRQKIPDEAELVDYLAPYWLAWSSRKTKNGRPYDASSLAWLTEWAVNGQIPPAYQHTGSGPPAVYTAAEKKKRAHEEYLRQKAALEAQDAGAKYDDHLAGGAEGAGQAAAQAGGGRGARAGPPA